MEPDIGFGKLAGVLPGSPGIDRVLFARHKPPVELRFSQGGAGVPMRGVPSVAFVADAARLVVEIPPQNTTITGGIPCRGRIGPVSREWIGKVSR
jgi:hypothetical protein